MRTLIVNAKIVNENKVVEGDVLISGERIERVDASIPASNVKVIDAQGAWLFPGVIDDQVHFREPGLTHKGEIFTESRAAVAGGVTSYMEMPNTIPPVFTRELLEDKYRIAANRSAGNYSFFMGASNDNVEEALRIDLKKVCGLKIFMGSSTGNLLVDNPETLEGFYSRFPGLIASHCEHEPTIRKNTAEYKERYGDKATAAMHPEIRNAEACYTSTRIATDLARRWGTRLHVLHISTARELSLFDNKQPLEEKKITAEACIHHLWFSSEDYASLGNRIKWNPAIKAPSDRAAIWDAVLNHTIDVIATDHAPHTLEEKSRGYFDAPSGGPLVQHSLVAMLEFHRHGKISLGQIADMMCHRPATLFRVEDRGYIREGYFADLVIVDPNAPFTVATDNILAKCKWSPFEGVTFQSAVRSTFVSGKLAWHEGRIQEAGPGMRLSFRA